MKKIVIALVFFVALATLHACKTTSACSAVEKQKINNTQTRVNVATEVVT
jgi:hypothetical protein